MGGRTCWRTGELASGRVGGRATGRADGWADRWADWQRQRRRAPSRRADEPAVERRVRSCFGRRVVAAGRQRIVARDAWDSDAAPTPDEIYTIRRALRLYARGGRRGVVWSSFDPCCTRPTRPTQTRQRRVYERSVEVYIMYRSTYRLAVFVEVDQRPSSKLHSARME